MRLQGHSAYFNTAVTSQEILAKSIIWTKKRAISISHNHIKMMQSMVYLILLFALILIKWHVTSQEIFTTSWINIKWFYRWFVKSIKKQLQSYIGLFSIIKDCLESSSQLITRSQDKNFSWLVTSPDITWFWGNLK